MPEDLFAVFTSVHEPPRLSVTEGTPSFAVIEQAANSSSPAEGVKADVVYDVPSEPELTVPRTVVTIAIYLGTYSQKASTTSTLSAMVSPDCL